jgi:hypothetical protein
MAGKFSPDGRYLSIGFTQSSYSKKEIPAVIEKERTLETGAGLLIGLVLIVMVR